MRVGIIADTHEPFCHPQYREFCYKTFNKYKVNKIIHIGDEVDNYALSYHEKDPDADSGIIEAEKAQKNMNGWYRTFPNVDVIVGNHSALPYRQATTAGIPKRFMKAYEEVWNAPKGWKWMMDKEVDHVLYTHGTGLSGQNGAINKAVRSRQSVVIGHIHSFGGVSYHASDNDLIFGLNVGCGINTRAYAFEYGKNFTNKPTLGCGIVLEGFQAFFIPMYLGKKYEWIK